LLFSCNFNTNEVHMDNIKKDFPFNHPDNFITPKGRKIIFVVKNNKYFIQWQQEDSLKTLNYPFDFIEEGNSSFPRFMEENEDYVLLRSGCGNPCWFGIFLPLYKAGQPKIVHEYIAVDLNSDLVASVKSSDSIEVLNLRTFDRQYIYPGKCESAFLGYCIDTAYFKEKYLHYVWTSETYINSNIRENKEFKIK
jgi:hypothetical protein